MKWKADRPSEVTAMSGREESNTCTLTELPKSGFFFFTKQTSYWRLDSLLLGGFVKRVLAAIGTAKPKAFWLKGGRQTTAKHKREQPARPTRYTRLAPLERDKQKNAYFLPFLPHLLLSILKFGGFFSLMATQFFSRKDYFCSKCFPSYFWYNLEWTNEYRLAYSLHVKWPSILEHVTLSLVSSQSLLFFSHKHNDPW